MASSRTVDLESVSLRQAARRAMLDGRLSPKALAIRIGVEPLSLRMYLRGARPSGFVAIERAVRSWLDARTRDHGSEFIRRLRLLVEQLGGPMHAAHVAEVKPATVFHWFELVEVPSFVAVALLALRAGVSLDWLAFGEFGSLERRLV